MAIILEVGIYRARPVLYSRGCGRGWGRSWAALALCGFGGSPASGGISPREGPGLAARAGTRPLPGRALRERQSIPCGKSPHKYGNAGPKPGIPARHDALSLRALWEAPFQRPEPPALFCRGAFGTTGKILRRDSIGVISPANMRSAPAGPAIPA